MPSIRLNMNTLEELEQLDPEELEELAGLYGQHRDTDLTTNSDARDRSAELRDRRKNDRRKSYLRGARRASSAARR